MELSNEVITKEKRALGDDVYAVVNEGRLILLLDTGASHAERIPLTQAILDGLNQYAAEFEAAKHPVLDQRVAEPVTEEVKTPVDEEQASA